MTTNAKNLAALGLHALLSQQTKKTSSKKTIAGADLDFIVPLHDELRTTIALTPEEAARAGDGLMHWDRISGGTDSTFEFLTPERVLANETSLDVDMQNFARAVAANAPTDFAQSFASFKATWDAFFASHNTSFQLLLPWVGTGPTWRQTESFRSQLAGWVGKYKALPGVPALTMAFSSAGQATLPPPGTPPPAAPFPWPAVFIALGVVALAGVVYGTWRFWKSRRSATTVLAAHDPGFLKHHPALLERSVKFLEHGDEDLGRGLRSYGAHVKEGFHKRPIRTAGAIVAQSTLFGLPIAQVLDPGAPKAFIRGYLGENEDEEGDARETPPSRGLVRHGRRTPRGGMS